jgi:hypothetical protein
MRVFTSHNFSESNADVILLTIAEDGIVSNFHVHKKVLSEASPFFETLFSLQQPSQPDQPGTLTRSLSGLPTVPLPDPAHILDQLLRFVYCHPIHHPPISSLDELTALLAVATKYELVPAIDGLRATLMSPSFMGMDPIRVYAIARRFDLDEEATVASRWTLNVDLLGDDNDELSCTPSLPHPSLRYISAYDFYQLLVLHRGRAKAARALLVIPDDIKCMQCNESVFTINSPPKWWKEWVGSAREALGTTNFAMTDRFFGVDHLFEVARRTGCAGCTESVLHSWTFLMELKGQIDKLVPGR